MPITSGQQIEVFDPEMTDIEVKNLRARQALFLIVQQLAPLPAGSGIASGVLGPGNYKGGALASNASVYGYGFPLVQGAVQVQGDATLIGCVFGGPIALAANSNAIFDGCSFSDTVSMAAGASACFGNCRFKGAGSVQNAGATVAAQIVGGLKTSSVSDSNVTVTGRA